MDINKAQNLLYKINNLFQSINMTENQISALEKDLMKNYILEFYDVFSEHEAPAKTSSKEKQEFPEVPISHAEVPFDDKLDQSMQESKDEVKEISRLDKDQNYPGKEDENGHDAVDKIPEDDQGETALEKVDQEPEEVVTKTQSEISPLAHQNEVFNLDPKLEALFAAPKVQDLSDKLSRAPIQDLGRAFGVNERILTINELFGGDIQLFNNTIQSINNMDRFEEAKKYLVLNVAKKNQWVNENKKYKASTFIKTVRRKFQS